jgi:hypothetical protein
MWEKDQVMCPVGQKGYTEFKEIDFSRCPYEVEIIISEE